MGGFVNFLKLFKRGMSIYLSSCQLLMPQQLLNALKSGAMIKHGCSKCMAQHVRAAFLSELTRARLSDTQTLTCG